MSPLRRILFLMFASLLILSANPAARGDDGGGDKGDKGDKGGGGQTANPASKKKRARGDDVGSYALTVSGHYAGTGTATVGGTVSLSADVKLKDGTAGKLVANNLTVTKGYFTGTGTVMGVTCTISGRVDLPLADDEEQTDQQAITGRITGTFKDANGHSGRIVAVENVATTGGDNGNGKDKGGGNDGG